MRTSIALVAGLGLALGSATVALAGDDDRMKPGAAGAATGAAVSAQPPLQGEVTEKLGDTLTIQRADGERSQIRTTDTTKVRGQNGDLEIGDIETGDQVRVTTMDSPGKERAGAGAQVASEIQVVARGAGDSGIRDPRQMSPGANPTQGSPDHDPDNPGTR